MFDLSVLTLLSLRRRQFLNLIRENNTRRNFKIIAVALFILVIWVGLYLGAYSFLAFITSIPGLGNILLERLGYLASFAFFILMLFSNTVISFQLHYRSRESKLLMTLPVSDRAVVSFIGLETVVLSSWASVFLAFPVFLAYGIAFKLPLSALIFLPVFGFMLAVLAASLGAMFASFIPRGKGPLIPILLVFFGAVALKFLSRFPGGELEWAGGLKATMIGNLLAHSRVTLSPLLPSAWAAQGFFCWVNGEWWRTLELLLVLAVNIMFFGRLSWEINSFILRDNFSRRLALNRNQKINRSFLSPILKPCLFFIPPSWRAVAIKDSLLFLRDPLQWLQGLVLFGLLALYIFGIRGFPPEAREPFWQALISTFNLSAASLILAALGARFVYPQVSLEGRAIWLLGLAPLNRHAILLTKLALSCLWGLPIMIILLLISSLYLALPWDLTLFSLVAAGAITIALDLLAIGMGALFPDFQEENPARIAAGFGGTLYLVTAVGLVIGVAIPLGISFQLRLTASFSGSFQIPFIVVVTALGLGLGVFIAGARRFRRLEF